ncbi:transposase [Chloroflexota bacterium]
MDVESLLSGVYEKGIKGMVKDIIGGKTKTEPIMCRYCGFGIIWKYGKNKSGVQRYKCPRCEKVFLDTDALLHMRIDVRRLGDILGQYFGGMSYKEIRRQYKQQYGDDISRSSFHRWVIKYSDIAKKEANKHTPEVGDTWYADECVLNVGGKKAWCFDVIDGDTRYLLATHISYGRKISDAKKLFEKAYNVAGKEPKVILSDGLKSYIDAIELVFGANTKHVQSKPFKSGELSTNKIERWHSTLRTREDIMRGLKSIPTAQALIDGIVLHYNYFRSHESLDGKTPAKVAKADYPYKDWLEVIESQRVKINPADIDNDSTISGTIERYEYPTYRVQKRRKLRKVKRASNKNQNPEIISIRRKYDRK